MPNFKNIKIDLKEKVENIADAGDRNFSQKNRTGRGLKIFFYLMTFAITSLIFFSSQIIMPETVSTSWLAKLPIINQFKHLAESADKRLKGEDRDRINILFLGVGGKNHEGGNLTDTIILLSLKPSSKEAAMLSIPRDLAVPVENMGWRKINNINALAEAQTPGSGGLATSQAVSDLLNAPIDYYARVDFTGFEKIIDDLGGIRIFVENTLEDYSYPAAGMEESEVYEDRFEHLYIEKGWHNMDGELALKYARSRHAAGAEGSDFARARRQQKIIKAVKDNIFSPGILFKPKMIANIINDLDKHISTNLKIWEIVKLWNMFKDVNTDDIVNKVLDNGPNGLLVDMISEEGAYILVPRNGDFAEIQYLVNNIFSGAPLEYKTQVVAQEASIEVRNGTWINGLAQKSALDLEKYGFKIVRIGNSRRQNFQKSVIYDLTYGGKIKSLTVLKNKTGANVSFGMPQWLIEEISEELAQEKNPTQPDFILILGQDADTSHSGAENLNE